MVVVEERRGRVPVRNKERGIELERRRVDRCDIFGEGVK